jgi:hypothetical protein
MNDLAMQNDRPSYCTNVRQMPVIWLGDQHRGNLPWGSGGSSHAVKLDVRLVSFPLSGVRNDLGSHQNPSPSIASSTAVLLCVYRNCDEMTPSCLPQLPQQFL